MCLILCSIEQHAKYRLVLASNRDEFLDRPTRPAAPWTQHAGMVAGQDLKAGGTWFGVTPSGRFGAVTNYRDRTTEKEQAPSRGKLVLDFISSSNAPDQFLGELHATAELYSGYNVLVGDSEQLWWYSNIKKEKELLSPGVHGLSNRFLNTPWPKVERGKEKLESLLKSDEIVVEHVFAMLKDETRAPDELLPDTGVGLDWERPLSSMFIRMPNYGTRCSSLLLMDYDGRITFVERTYPADGSPPFDTRFVKDTTNHFQPQ